MTMAVIPVHKGGDRDNCGSHKPVSLIYIVAKSLERILLEGTVNRLEANKTMAVEQHGFWHKRSYMANLISMPNKVTGKVYKGEKVEICDLDFQEALDSVNHGLLGHKSKAFKVDVRASNWITESER